MAAEGTTPTKRRKRAGCNAVIDRLWRRYQLDKMDTAVRNRLVEHYLHQAKNAARKFVENKPLVFEDVYSAACEGLVEAVEGYDPARGFAFSTYSTPRIRGAMLDWMRAGDHLSRLSRIRDAQRRKTEERLTAQFNRRPTVQEIEDELPADLVVGPSPALFSIDEKIEFDRGGEKDAFIKDMLPAKRQKLNGEDFSWLAGYLGEDDRTAVYLYFFKDVAMHTIGVLLGMCESRISQRMTAALNKLAALKREEAAELSIERESP